MNQADALLAAGCATTGATLAAGHWYRWWRPLGRLGAYTFGVSAILLGMGVYLRFSRQWFKLCLIAATGGATVLAAYQIDDHRNSTILRRAAGGQRIDGIPPTD